MLGDIGKHGNYFVGGVFIVTAGSLYEKLQQYLNWVSDSRQAKLLKGVCAILLFCAGGYLIYTSNRCSSSLDMKPYLSRKKSFIFAMSPMVCDVMMKGKKPLDWYGKMV